MKRDKEHFRHLLLLWFERNSCRSTDLSQKLILSLLHQSKHVSTDFDD